jgi:integrase
MERVGIGLLKEKNTTLLSKLVTTKKNTGFSLKKEKKPKWYRTEEFELNDGEILVYRSNKGGKYWSCRIWINEEQKYLVKSLKTKDRERSIELAKKIYRETHHKLLEGEPVFDKTLGELVELYLNEKKETIRYGETGGGRGKHGITEGRYTTIKTQTTRHLLGFIKGSTKLGTLNKLTFENKYYKYRKRKNPEVTTTTIINERVTINNVLEYGVKRGLLKPTQLPYWEKLSKPKSNSECFTREQWKDVYTFLRGWVDNEEDLIEKINKEFVRHFILIACNTGLRVGEMRFMKWGNVTTSKEGRDYISVIDVKISKTGERKGVIGRKGQYFNRLKKISNHTKRNDWIFVDNRTGKQLGKTTLYRLWKEILKGTGLDKFGSYTYYTLRHTYCTQRLLNGTDVFLLSKNMGTSVQHIENTYGHVKLWDKRHQLTGRKTESDKVLFD